MKKILWLFIAVVYLLVVPSCVFASDNNGIGSILESKEEQGISNVGTDNPEDIRICIEAYNKKNNGVAEYSLDNSSDDIHASENIKIHAFTTKKPSVFYSEYEACNNLMDFVSPNYSIIRVFRDGNNRLIDSVFYMKPENSKQDDSDWKRVSSGGMIFSDETIELLTDENELLNLLKSYNIENPQNLEVITGIEGLEGALYFEYNGVQIIMPLSDGYRYDSEVVTCEKLIPYVASEFFEARKESDIANERKLKEWDNLPMNEKTYGNSNIINYVDLKPAIFTDTIELNTEIVQNTAYTNAIVKFAGFFMLGLLVIIGVVVKMKK